MDNTPLIDGPRIGPEEIREAVHTRLEKYKGRSVIERYALFMGMAQLLEFQLKAFFSRRYSVDLDSLEKKSLGGIYKKLVSRGLRADFLALLETVKDHRNHMAHAFLVDAYVTRQTFLEYTRWEDRDLDRGAYALEYLFVVFEWIEANNAWGSDAPEASGSPSPAGRSDGLS